MFSKLYHLIKLVNRFKIKSKTTKLYNYIWFIYILFEGRRRERKNVVPVQWCRIYLHHRRRRRCRHPATSHAAWTPNTTIFYDHRTLWFYYYFLYMYFFQNKIHTHDRKMVFEWISFASACILCLTRLVRWCCRFFNVDTPHIYIIYIIYINTHTHAHRYQRANRIKWFVASFDSIYIILLPCV